MKRMLLFLLLCQALPAFAQKGYPVPTEDVSRLFYIQHSNNHNTFVYDANMAGKKLNTADPVSVYRLCYTKGKTGLKEELSGIQRKMAYGITLTSAEAASCTFTLAAYPAKKIAVHLDKNGRPYAAVHVNGKNIVLKKMFLLVNKSGTNVVHIDFYGKDAATGKDVVERFYVKD
ncbi:DUF4833 domain-containing protein [Flavobacterium sp. RHBU_24]|uniref:DUF4833 domain-containing protein n=1 Tax=Flavobacterium sp. RHBU_24 TaxID=3391185 RepID=UPI003984B149